MEKEYLDKLYGKKIAKKNVISKISKLSCDKNNLDEISKLMMDLDEIEKENIKIIRKYIGENSGK